MAKYEVGTMTATVTICGVPLKVKWAKDKNGPELFIWGECTAEQAQAILQALPEDSKGEKP